MAVKADEKSRVKRSSCWISDEIIRQAKTIAAIEDKSLSDVLDEILERAVEKRFASVTAKAAAELGESGA